jgi:hypothetical protein
VRAIGIVLAFCVFATVAHARPADWSQSDWEKFIEEAVQIGLGETLSAAGGVVPLVDLYSALSAAGSSTNVGLQLWLNTKMVEAELDNDLVRLDRYQAFASCAAGDCSRLAAATNPGPSDNPNFPSTAIIEPPQQPSLPPGPQPPPRPPVNQSSALPFCCSWDHRATGGDADCEMIATYQECSRNHWPSGYAGSGETCKPWPGTSYPLRCLK